VRECRRGFFGTRGRAVKLEFLPPPEQGRRFVARRRVRLGDVNRANRLRLDAVARYLQDVAADDVDDIAETRADGAWVLRRTALAIAQLPRYGDDVELTTFCTGTGSMWAERRTTLAVGGAAAAEAVAIWVYVDRGGRPERLGDWFFDHYGEAADGRKVSGRLSLPRPPDHAHARAWPVRASDFDLLGHVNNAAYWFAVEDELARLAPDHAPVGAELEHRAALEPEDPVELRSTLDDDVLSVWLTVRGEARSAARLRLRASPGSRRARN
jgi:acyl-ACP thioesterase